VWGIPSQLQQLFQNLISNSLKFSKPERYPQIIIYSQTIKGSTLVNKDEKQKSNFYHQIHIIDKGIGFDPKYAEDIFVVFKRLHSYHEFEGTGIGLSICKKIVEKHHGYIWAEATLNEGAHFTMVFPQQDYIKQPTLLKKQTVL
jgi:light-regulated signal transduction histidine kinase (bacteriophytochrome)